MSARRRGEALSGDYDSDPGRFAANQEATRRFSVRGDVHPVVARRLAAEGCRRVLDIGGGNGALARELAAYGITTVVVDRADHIADAPRPSVRADARQLPFADGVFDGAAALWMLYHLPDPVRALREAHRVLRPGGLLAVSTASRRNDPELAPVLPDWGRPLTFDAENGPEQLGDVFDAVDVDHWNRPMMCVPDHDALALVLRGRGLSASLAATAARRLVVPLTVTKCGLIGWARKVSV